MKLQTDDDKERLALNSQLTTILVLAVSNYFRIGPADEQLVVGGKHSQYY